MWYLQVKYYTRKLYSDSYHHDRQFIAEFCAKDMPIYLLNTHGESKNTTTEELLPFAFTKDDM